LKALESTVRQIYGISLFAALLHGTPIPVDFTVRYQVEAARLAKLINIIHDAPKAERGHRGAPGDPSRRAI